MALSLVDSGAFLTSGYESLRLKSSVVVVDAEGSFVMPGHVFVAGRLGCHMRRNAALLVLISVLSGFGGTALSLAAGIWIFDLTGDPGLAALAALGVYLPSLAAPWLGAVVDRFPRRILLITVEAVVGILLLALLPVDSAGQVWLIHLVMLMRGFGYVLLDAGETALLPAVLPVRLLGDVNGWRSSGQEGMKLLAPLAGAGLYAWAGPRPVVLLCAVLPLINAVLYALLRLTAAPTAATAPSAAAASAASTAATAVAAPAVDGSAADGGGGEGRAGFGWGSVRDGLVVLGREPLRTPVLLATVAIAVAGLTNAAVLSRLVDGLHLPATYLGVLSSAQGAGSIVAGLLVGRLLARTSAARVAAVGAGLFALACVARMVPWWPSMIAGSVLTGVGLVWALIAAVTAIQTGTPGHLLGRVAATGNTAMFGPQAVTIPLGAAMIGIGDQVTLAVGAVLIPVTVALVVRRPAGLGKVARDRNQPVTKGRS